ncbi:MAG: YfhO family protein [Saprospiraceae bacterium]|nr:YfhO family protein [Saprospiraceae bacterium]
MKQIVPHAVALITFLILSCLYFYPQIEGKTLSQTDINSYKGMAQEVIKYEEETGETSLWTNSIFSGMPTYQIRSGKGANQVKIAEKMSHLFFSRPIGFFIGAMVGVYILLLVLGVSPWIAMIGAVGFALSTNNIVLFEAGHTSKLRAIFWVAPAIAGTILTFRRKYVIGGALFALAMAVNLYVNHFQMTYYLLLLLGIYGLFVLRDAVKTREYKPFFIAVAVLIGGVLLAVGSSASKILTTMELAEDTMRGKPILESNEASAASSSETDGLAWDYAMSWSNGVPDVLAMLVPRAAGGSGAEPTGEKSELYQDFQRRGVRLGGEFAEPLYWGDLPFTSGPAYMGALLMFLFILGAILVPGRLKWWIVTCVLLTVAMSMGKHLAVLNQLLFDYLPLYNKFRAPSSILTITAVFIPILAALGISRFFSDQVARPEKRKALLWALGTTGGMCLLLAAIGPSLFSLEGASDASYANAGYNVDAIVADRAKFLRADALRSLLLIVLGAAALFAHMKGSLRALWVTVAIGLLVVIDLWGIGRRYISPDDFVSQSLNEQVFALRDVDREILRDEDLHYRVHDLTVDPWNNSIRSYHHRTVGGYNAAKLQRYQDLIDYYLSRGTPHVLNMLNTKYFIVPGDTGPRVQRNFQAYGNAWFVEGIRIVQTADEEIAALENLDPQADAIVHKDFEHLVAGFDPVKNGTIELIEYKPNKLTYRSNTQSDQLAVFSEIWYGPDKGWQAYIDGQPVEHLRANYVLRALNVPAGEHTIVFEFDPKTHRLGETLSLIFSLLILLGFAAALWYTWKNRPPEAAVPVEKKAGAPPKRHKGRKKKRSGQ